MLISMGKLHTHTRTHTHTHTHKSLTVRQKYFHRLHKTECLKLISVLLSLVHTVIKHWSSEVSDKWTTSAIVQSFSTTTTKAEPSRWSRKTWCSQQGRIPLHIQYDEKMGYWLEMWQGDSGICLRRPIIITSQETIAKVSIIVDRRVQSFTLSQGVSSLYPKTPWMHQEWTQNNLSRKNDNSASSGSLWPQMKPCSITFNQRWNQSSGKVLCLTRKLKHWCLRARWWSIFYRMQMEYCCWTT